MIDKKAPDPSSDDPKFYDRRQWMTTSAAVAGALIGTGSVRGQENIKHVREAQHGQSASNPGPDNKPISSVQPDADVPPPTDQGNPPNFWNTFSSQHRRIQPGGWARQVTVREFPISTTIAGVNMRLTPGGIRELHWHATAEWAIMLTGKARITNLDDHGRMFVTDVGVGDLWFFPQGNPHSIQGLPPDGCEFLLVFDDGKFSEDDTTLLSSWLRHTPPEVLAKNWQAPPSAVQKPYDIGPGGKWIFQADIPPSLDQDQKAAAQHVPLSPHDFTFRLMEMKPTYKTKGGEVRIVDSRVFKVSNMIAAAHVIVHPGGLRALHWHQNADEWQYYISGKGRMTVFFNGTLARTQDFEQGDVGYIPKTLPHYIENTGNEDLVFLETFRTDTFMEISLNGWLKTLPPELTAQTIDMDPQKAADLAKQDVPVIPA
ncbi:MAG: cupin domain-containing protein [Acidobacteriaceae bacterium]|nr:cupin domain-containing protein [Acidobacteriaceae bacterium]MBV9307777.1 cupin domain-containing protein [Acidobacteriaceae bacterium]